MVIGCFFFFKQKTAYEVRISDWSSDVCSSDLLPAGLQRRRQADAMGAHQRAHRRHAFGRRQHAAVDGTAVVVGQALVEGLRVHASIMRPAGRSEEHTSELQSLMRISYAVFCLNKKKTTQTQTTNNKK